MSADGREPPIIQLQEGNGKISHVAADPLSAQVPVAE